MTVPADAYVIRAEYPHWSQTQKTTVFDRQSASCIFSPQYGALHLTCNRTGATYQLFANEQMVDSGILPATIADLPSGLYQITVTYNNRQLQKSVFLKANVTNEVPVDFVLGAARLVTDPAGVSVETMNGSYLGQTPLDVPDLPPQPVQFRLSKPGYEPATVWVDIVADQTTTGRTNLINTRYLNSMKAARQSLAAANYESAAQAIGEALDAKPGDLDALALQNDANAHLSAERQRQEQLKRPRQAFNSLCAQYPDARLFTEYGFKTSMAAKEISAAIAKSLEEYPQGYEIKGSRTPQTETYETVAQQTFSLGILGGSERICLLVVGQTKDDETQILFKVLEYQVQHVLQVNGLLNAQDEKKLIPINSTRMQMTDVLQARVREGVQNVSNKIKQVIGQQ